MKKHDIGTQKHEKAVRIGWISTVFRIARARSMQQSVNIWG